MNYGYARVSTKEQNLDRQIIALKEAGCEESHIYADKASGKDFERKQYQKMVKKLRSGDCLIIKSIDRLGRNYNEIGEQWRLITKVKKSDIKVLDMPLLDTTYNKDIMGTFISDLVLQVLSFTAETERNFIKQRQAEGIAIAKAKGVKFGRPMSPYPAKWNECIEKFKKGETIYAINKFCPEISYTTMRKRLLETVKNEQFSL